MVLCLSLYSLLPSRLCDTNATMSSSKVLTPRPPLNRARKEAQAARRRQIRAVILVILAACGLYMLSQSQLAVATSTSLVGACRSLSGGTFTSILDPKQSPHSWDLPNNLTISTCQPWTNQRAVYRNPEENEESNAGPLTAFAAETRIFIPQRALNDSIVLLRRTRGPTSKTVQETGKVAYMQAPPETDSDSEIETIFDQDDVPVHVGVYHSDPQVLDGLRVCTLAKEDEPESIVGFGVFRDTTYDRNQCLALLDVLRVHKPEVTRWMHVVNQLVFPRPDGDDSDPLVVNGLLSDFGGEYEQDFSPIWDSSEARIVFNSLDVDGKKASGPVV
ncbi:hypothetical protein MIND_00640300 [Mycena indigotica]|uniref:Uncharacterized protein n=1 Tax=Mycena indigotica TaxID=2126181 RepID=A0A8H6SRW0_9AGAR|nr:uncharacterized protein MIND_00640300 [Mycena indigotica]KAF7304088.1 hypothetical protein MIND_00640300 [Mycena indigotica]